MLHKSVAWSFISVIIVPSPHPVTWPSKYVSSSVTRNSFRRVFQHILVQLRACPLPNPCVAEDGGFLLAVQTQNLIHHSSDCRPWNAEFFADLRDRFRILHTWVDAAVDFFDDFRSRRRRWMSRFCRHERLSASCSILPVS